MEAFFADVATIKSIIGEIRKKLVKLNKLNDEAKTATTASDAKDDIEPAFDAGLNDSDSLQDDSESDSFADREEDRYGEAGSGTKRKKRSESIDRDNMTKNSQTAKKSKKSKKSKKRSKKMM